MSKSGFSPRRIALCGLIAALYTAAGLALAPIGFGPVQCRVAEALTILPVLGSLPIIGVTLGCAITNAVGAATGMNILGALDVPVGTAATLIAALLTFRLRKITVKGLPVLAPLPPVVVNAVVIGWELAAVNPGGFQWPMFWLMAAQVGLGQFLACYLLGLPLYAMIKKTRLAEKLADG